MEDFIKLAIETYEDKIIAQYISTVLTVTGVEVFDGAYGQIIFTGIEVNQFISRKRGKLCI